MKKKYLCPSCKNNLFKKIVKLPFFTHFKFYLINKKTLILFVKCVI